MTTTTHTVGARYTVAVPSKDTLEKFTTEEKKRVVATMLNLRMSGSGVYEGTTGVLLPVPAQFADDPIFEGVVNFLPDNQEPDSEGNGWPIAREMLVPAEEEAPAEGKTMVTNTTGLSSDRPRTQTAAVPSADFRTF